MIDNLPFTISLTLYVCMIVYIQISMCTCLFSNSLIKLISLSYIPFDSGLLLYQYVIPLSKSLSVSRYWPFLSFSSLYNVKVFSYVTSFGLLLLSLHVFAIELSQRLSVTPCSTRFTTTTTTTITTLYRDLL